MRTCAALATAALLLSACSGGGGGGGDDAANLSSEIDQRCVSLGQTGATIAYTSEACPDCSAAEEHKAIDRVDSTFASLTAPIASTGQMSLRATAPLGVTYPGGSNAALTLSVSDGSGISAGAGGASVESGGDNDQEWHVSVRTYLDGLLQEQDSDFVHVDQDGEHWRHVVGITTTKPFDSIEAVFDRTPDAEHAMENVSGASYTAEPGDVRVHEFCSDFDLSGLNVSGG